jgi:hypothetical protein
MNIAADWSELATAVVAAIGLAATVGSIWAASYRASRERKAALDQAGRDQTWRQTVEAQAAVRRLLDDKRAFEAMSMLDYWDGQTFPTVGEITKEDILNALQAVGPGFDQKQAFVRAAMDSLFSHFELIQQGIDAKIYMLEDVKFPIDYYIKKMGQINGGTFIEYSNKSNFHKSNALITAILEHPSKDSR